jgi:hypothetical protein
VAPAWSQHAGAILSASEAGQGATPAPCRLRASSPRVRSSSIATAGCNGTQEVPVPLGARWSCGILKEQQPKLGHAVQIKPGLQPLSPKNGNISKIRRRLSAISVLNGRIWSPETGCQFAKARYWRAFLALLRAKSLTAGLAGWRRSGDRTGLATSNVVLFPKNTA